MVNELFIIMGIIIMVISTLICADLIARVKEKISWLAVFALIIFFLAGYIIYFIINLKNAFDISAGDFLESQILFWGSIFVILVLFVSRRMFNNSEKIINDLQNLTQKYEKQKESLEEIKIKMSEKNQKLEEIIEEFYNYRIAQEKNNPDKKIILNNIKLKEQIDNLKFNK